MLLVPFVNLAISACSSATDGEAAPEAAGDIEQESLFDLPSRPSLRVLVGNDTASWKTVYLPVLRESAGAGGPKAGLWRTDREPEATAGVQTRNLVEEPLSGSDAGYWPVLAAAAECGVYNSDSGLDPDPHGYPFDPVVPTSETWLVFSMWPENCDDVTHRVSVLTCMAGKLEELATALTPVRWERADALDGAAVPGWDMPDGPWIIPPLAPESRVVVRSLARLTLAYVAKALTQDLGDSLLDESCATLYSNVIEQPSLVNDTGLAIATFGAEINQPPAYPSLSGGSDVVLTADNADELAADRLRVLTHALRAGSRILDENVTRSVEDDVAQAARKRSRATDLIEANAAAWGLRPDGTMPEQESKKYGTYGHALRVLTGRLEMGSGVPDPACGGTQALDLVKVANGPSTSARVTFPPVTTPDEQRARCTVEGMGVVIPNPEGVDISGAREALAAQSILEAAVAAGVDPNDSAAIDAFGQTSSAEALRQHFAAIPDGALRSALKAKAHTYALLTDQAPADVSTVDCTLLGLSCADHAASSVASLGGTVTAGPIPKADLTIDSKARSLHTVVAGQCPADFSGNIGDLWKPEEESEPNAYANPFALAQRFARHLTQIRELASASQSTEVDVVPVAETARAAVAEIDAWAGRTVVTLTTDADAGEPSNIGALNISVGGLALDDLGISDEMEQTLTEAERNALIGDQFVLVFGTPAVADCVAGLRRTCEPSVVALRQGGPSETPTVLDLRSNPIERREMGMDGLAVGLRFDPAQATVSGAPISYGDTSGALLYLVQKHDPLASTSRGKVLAAFAVPPDATTATTATISSKQDDLVDRITGISHSWSVEGCSAGTVDPGFSRDHCVGVSRSQMVPLENELMEATPGDELEKSWRYWLNRAKESSAQTDELARQMIEEGLQQDMRREAAQEQLAQLCGSYAAADEIEFDDYGRIKTPEEGTSVASCIDEERHPIVFLTTMPESGKSGEWVKREVLRCTDAANVPDIGASNPLCDAADSVFEHNAALNLAVHESLRHSDSVVCSEAAAAVESLASSFGSAGGLIMRNAVDGWLTRGGLQLTLEGMQIEVDFDQRWRVNNSGRILMDSSPTSGVFPGCLAAGASPCDPALAAQITNFSRAFRSASRNERKDPSPCFGCAAEECPANTALQLETVDGEKLCALELETGELGAILWRVEGAVWFVASAAGRAPEGLLVSPIPIANFSNTSAWSQVPRIAPVHTVYRSSRINSSGYLDVFGADANVLGLVTSVDVGFGWPNNGEVPDWVREPYVKENELNHDGAYVHVRHLSPELDFGVYSPEDANSGWLPWKQIVAAWNALSGIECANQFAGSPYSTLTPHQEQASAYLGAVVRSPLCPSLSASGSQATCPNQACDNPYNCHVEGAYSSPFMTTCGMQESVICSNDPEGEGGDTIGNRVVTASNSYPPVGACGAAARLGQAVLMACESAARSQVTLSEPPSIVTPLDFFVIESWIREQAVRTRMLLGKLYLEQLPTRVVEDLRRGVVGSGSKDGTHGTAVARLAPELRAIVNSWLAIENSLNALADAVKVARERLNLIEIEGRIQDREIAIRQVQATAAIAKEVGGAVSGLIGAASTTDAVAGLVGAASSATQQHYLAQQQALLNELASLNGEEVQAKTTLAVLELAETTREQYYNLRVALNQLSSSTAEVMALAHEIRQAERNAQFAAAKAKGESFVVIDGEPVAIPVNAVLNRQYQLTKQRYERSLDESKYLAFMARLAVERRIGRRLEDLDAPLGPMEAPSIWADDVCSMSGVDYEALREVDMTMFPEIDMLIRDPDAGPAIDIDPAVLDTLMRDVSPFVGDYVRKLELFVDAYNIAYPFQQGDDTAVLSVRDDVLGPRESCVVPSRNLLLFSDQLHAAQGGGSEGAYVGWARSACEQGASRCVEAKPGAALGTPDGVTPATFAPIPPGGVGATGATWIREVPESEAEPWNGPQGEAHGVSQVVWLESPGTYLLSWWDQARRRTDLGAFMDAADPQVEYRVQVLDDSSTAIASFTGYPFRPNTAQEAPEAAWSDRRQIAFEVADAGYYTVVFAPSAGTGDLGSLVVANAQLEAVGSVSTVASAYSGNGASAETVGRCGSLPPGELRAAFQRACTPEGDCYYELTEPLSIDAEMLATESGYLGGNFARGNYNFRHITVALNLAGTGLIDCEASPTTSCYGDGTIRYTLEHDAYSAEVVAGIWQGEIEKHRFNFGSGAIRHGQALAAERFITSPVGSADMALLSQPGILKTELLGRPLSGIYRLRIWETPGLMWDRLEDVQLVLKYRYWSAVQAAR